MFDPFMTIATAAAMTQRDRLGIQVVAPYYEPLWLANALASLDTLCSGRAWCPWASGGPSRSSMRLSSDFSNPGPASRR